MKFRALNFDYPAEAKFRLEQRAASAGKKGDIIKSPILLIASASTIRRALEKERAAASCSLDNETITEPKVQTATTNESTNNKDRDSSSPSSPSSPKRQRVVRFDLQPTEASSSKQDSTSKGESAISSKQHPSLQQEQQQPRPALIVQQQQSPCDFTTAAAKSTSSRCQHGTTSSASRVLIHQLDLAVFCQALHKSVRRKRIAHEHWSEALRQQGRPQPPAPLPSLAMLVSPQHRAGCCGQPDEMATNQVAGVPSSSSDGMDTMACSGCCSSGMKIQPSTDNLLQATENAWRHLQQQNQQQGTNTPLLHGRFGKWTVSGEAFMSLFSPSTHTTTTTPLAKRRRCNEDQPSSSSSSFTTLNVVQHPRTPSNNTTHRQQQVPLESCTTLVVAKSRRTPSATNTPDPQLLMFAARLAMAAFQQQQQQQNRRTTESASSTPSSPKMQPEEAVYYDDTGHPLPFFSRPVPTGAQQHRETAVGHYASSAKKRPAVQPQEEQYSQGAGGGGEEEATSGPSLSCLKPKRPRFLDRGVTFSDDLDGQLAEVTWDDEKSSSPHHEGIETTKTPPGDEGMITPSPAMLPPANHTGSLAAQIAGDGPLTAAPMANGGDPSTELTTTNGDDGFPPAEQQTVKNGKRDGDPAIAEPAASKKRRSGSNKNHRKERKKARKERKKAKKRKRREEKEREAQRQDSSVTPSAAQSRQPSSGIIPERRTLFSGVTNSKVPSRKQSALDHLEVAKSSLKKARAPKEENGTTTSTSKIRLPRGSKTPSAFVQAVQNKKSQPSSFLVRAVGRRGSSALSNRSQAVADGVPGNRQGAPQQQCGAAAMAKQSTNAAGMTKQYPSISNRPVQQPPNLPSVSAQTSAANSVMATGVAMNHHQSGGQQARQQPSAVVDLTTTTSGVGSMTARPRSAMVDLINDASCQKPATAAARSIIGPHQKPVTVDLTQSKRASAPHPATVSRITQPMLTKSNNNQPFHHRNGPSAAPAATRQQPAVDESMLPPVQLVCSEGFLETWGDVVAALASGKWAAGVSSPQQNVVPISANNQTTTTAGRKIQLLDTPLLNKLGVDIELPNRGGVLAFTASALEDVPWAKTIVIMLAELAAKGRYSDIYVFICYDIDPNQVILRHITQLQNAVIQHNGQPLSRVFFKTTCESSLSASLAETILCRNRLSSSTHYQEGLSDFLANEQQREWAWFLVELIPTLSGNGAIQCLQKAKALSGSFRTLLESQEMRNKIWTLATSVPSRASEIHPMAMPQLSLALDASSDGEYK